MKRPYLRVLRATGLVIAIASLLWLAAPKIDSIVNKDSSSQYAIGAYLPQGTLNILKRDATTGQLVTTLGVEFSVSPNPYGPGVLYVSDNGPNDTNPAVGVITLLNVPTGTYTILEILAPAGYSVNPNSFLVTLTAQGQTATGVSLDNPLAPLPVGVPSVSVVGLWLMTGVFAAAIGGLTWRRSRTR